MRLHIYATPVRVVVGFWRRCFPFWISSADGQGMRWWIVGRLRLCEVYLIIDHPRVGAAGLLEISRIVVVTSSEYGRKTANILSTGEGTLANERSRRHYF